MVKEVLVEVDPDSEVGLFKRMETLWAEQSSCSYFCHQSQEPGLGEWRQRGREEVEARETSPQWGWTGSIPAWRRGKENSQLADPLCLGDQEEVMAQTEKGSWKESWMGNDENLFLDMLRLR